MRGGAGGQFSFVLLALLAQFVHGPAPAFWVGAVAVDRQDTRGVQSGSLIFLRHTARRSHGYSAPLLG